MNWKPISGYEGYYEVSDTGLIRSLDRYIPRRFGKDKEVRMCFYKGHVMKLYEDNGYLVVNLRKQCKSDVRKVHRLVGEAFIENPKCLPFINHIDGNKKNNNVSNLEWCTAEHNNIHAYKTGLHKPRFGTKVIQIDKNNNIISEYESIHEAERETGINKNSIWQVVNNWNGRGNGLAGGYRWVKAEKCNDYPDMEYTGG